MKEFPKTFKFGRVFRTKDKSYMKAFNNLNVQHCKYGIKSLENGKMTIKHLNALSRLLKRLYKKDVRVKYNLSFVVPVTKKPLETRMGKGKGERDHWECVIRRGNVLLEFGGKFLKLKRGLRLVRSKLPVFSFIVSLTY